MFDEHVAQFQREAVAAFPNEAVWLILADGTCRRVKNCAAEPTKTFRVSKKDMAKAQSKGLAAVVHSHPNYPACPSEADMRGQMDTAVPWGIVATDGQAATGVTWWGDCAPKAPLDDRGFVHGVTDCYELIRDWYAQERGDRLPQFPRSWNWWRDGGDLYRQGFAEAGFDRIDITDAEPGDVWLSQIHSDVPNHAGVLLDNGLCIHHPAARQPVDPKRRSRVEPIVRYMPYITHVLRYAP